MTDKLYSTAAWKRLRKSHLSRFPLCVSCETMGKLTFANTVDHIVPISAGGPAFPSHDGLHSYCAACHSRKTARGVEAGAVRTRKPIKGCDINGHPLDPAHPWNTEKSLRADALAPPANTNIELVRWG